jgi:protein-disulfide isomerase
MFNRRLALCVLTALIPARSAFSWSSDLQRFKLTSDDGQTIQNFRIPSELDPATVPGLIWSGRKDADVILFEFFDYNCSFCHQAAKELNKVLSTDPGVRLGLINNPILSLGSMQAAKVQQAVLRIYGPRAAYNFHSALFNQRGQKDGTLALDVALAAGLNRDMSEETADSAIIADVISRQIKLAENLGMSLTPSFILAGTGALGWMGINSLKEMIISARKCDQVSCL